MKIIYQRNIQILIHIHLVEDIFDPLIQPNLHVRLCIYHNIYIYTSPTPSWWSMIVSDHAWWWRSLATRNVPSDPHQSVWRISRHAPSGHHSWSYRNRIQTPRILSRYDTTVYLFITVLIEDRKYTVRQEIHRIQTQQTHVLTKLSFVEVLTPIRHTIEPFKISNSMHQPLPQFVDIGCSEPCSIP